MSLIARCHWCYSLGLNIDQDRLEYFGQDSASGCGNGCKCARICESRRVPTDYVDQISLSDCIHALRTETQLAFDLFAARTAPILSFFAFCVLLRCLQFFIQLYF